MTSLKHHGVKGQKWGVKNGPPYPLVKTSSRNTAKNSNDIYKSLTLDEKRKVTAREEPPKEYTNDFEYKTYLAKSFIVKYKDTPVSVFDIWRENDKDVALAMMTRNGDEYRGKGFAKKASKAAMDYLEKSSFEKAYWDVRKDNKASIALAKKYGFVLDGEFGENNEWYQYVKDLKYKEVVK